MIFLPLQPLIAAEADFAHLVESQHSEEKTILHMLDHFEHVAHHHHDDDGDSHEDDSPQSKLHFLSSDHGCSVNVMPSAQTPFHVVRTASTPFLYVPLSYLNPTTSPPLRPPHLAL